MSKEKLRKTNAVNCGKLAHELPFGSFEKELYLGGNHKNTLLYKTKKNLIAKRQHTYQEPYQVFARFYGVEISRMFCLMYHLARDIPKIEVNLRQLIHCELVAFWSLPDM